MLLGVTILLSAAATIAKAYRLAEIGHNPPVGVAFQFQWLGRRAGPANGCYSPSKLTSSLPRPGHERSLGYTSQKQTLPDGSCPAY
jgi:hypothetical protein